MTLRDEAVGLLRRLLRLDTSNPPGNETAAAELLRAYLEANGVACELVARDPARANLVARLPGTGGGPSLMLLGHTDVVPAVAEDWTRPPFGGELDDEGYVWGRGAVDMKNEVATRAVAIAHLARSGWRGSGDLLFVAVADEEDGSEGARHAPRAGVHGAAAVDPEAELLPTICNGFTDSHYLREAFGAVAYGIWPVRTTPYAVAAAGVHGVDERIHVDDVGLATRFHVELCRALLGDGGTS